MRAKLERCEGFASVVGRRGGGAGRTYGRGSASLRDVQVRKLAEGGAGDGGGGEREWVA